MSMIWAKLREGLEAEQRILREVKDFDQRWLDTKKTQERLKNSPLHNALKEYKNGLDTTDNQSARN